MTRRNAKTYYWQRTRIEKQGTQPFPAGNRAFRSYLETHRLTIFEVAKAPEVRLATLWNVQHNIPIQAEREPRVRAALRGMTGVAYTGPIMVHPVEEPKLTQGRRGHESI